MKNHKTNVQYIVIILIFSVIAGFTFISQNNQVSNEVNKLVFKDYIIAEKTGITGKVAGVEAGKANISFDKGQGTTVNFDADIVKEQTTVFDLLQDLNSSMNLGLKYKKYDFGVMIESLFGVDNGVDGKYWLYYVNGQSSMNSVDQQKVNDGDKIEFKFEKSNF